jgi:hypothetical protein
VDRSGAEQIVLEVRIEGRVVPSQPFEDHRGVLFFLVPVVDQDGSEFLVVGCLGALIVPVDRLQLLHQRSDRPVAVYRLRSECCRIFMQ